MDGRTHMARVKYSYLPRPQTQEPEAPSNSPMPVASPALRGGLKVLKALPQLEHMSTQGFPSRGFRDLQLRSWRS